MELTLRRIRDYDWPLAEMVCTLQYSETIKLGLAIRRSFVSLLWFYARLQ